MQFTGWQNVILWSLTVTIEHAIFYAAFSLKPIPLEEQLLEIYVL